MSTLPPGAGEGTPEVNPHVLQSSHLSPKSNDSRMLCGSNIQITSSSLKELDQITNAIKFDICQIQQVEEIQIQKIFSTNKWIELNSEEDSHKSIKHKAKMKELFFFSMSDKAQSSGTKKLSRSCATRIVEDSLWDRFALPISSPLIYSSRVEPKGQMPSLPPGAGEGTPEGCRIFFISKIRDLAKFLNNWENMKLIKFRLDNYLLLHEVCKCNEAIIYSMVHKWSLSAQRIVPAILEFEYWFFKFEIDHIYLSGWQRTMTSSIKIPWFHHPRPLWSVVYLVRGDIQPNVTERSLLATVGCFVQGNKLGNFGAFSFDRTIIDVLNNFFVIQTFSTLFTYLSRIKFKCQIFEFSHLDELHIRLSTLITKLCKCRVNLNFMQTVIHGDQLLPLLSYSLLHIYKHWRLSFSINKSKNLLHIFKACTIVFSNDYCKMHWNSWLDIDSSVLYTAIEIEKLYEKKKKKTIFSAIFTSRVKAYYSYDTYTNLDKRNTKHWRKLSTDHWLYCLMLNNHDGFGDIKASFGAAFLLFLKIVF
ncbi:hypothetical protein M5K25_020769 [Dendrobium thyrsiflorum]|uniref:Uncharacterized protein n=1 Tax=Dendrobium thyrsiflorum TaxID=117978 RepID=A0ABD0UHN7_DENTH